MQLNVCQILLCKCFTSIIRTTVLLHKYSKGLKSLIKVTLYNNYMLMFMYRYKTCRFLDLNFTGERPETQSEETRKCDTDSRWLWTVKGGQMLLFCWTWEGNLLNYQSLLNLFKKNRSVERGFSDSSRWCLWACVQMFSVRGRSVPVQMVVGAGLTQDWTRITQQSTAACLKLVWPRLLPADGWHTGATCKLADRCVWPVCLQRFLLVFIILLFIIFFVLRNILYHLRWSRRCAGPAGSPRAALTELGISSLITLWFPWRCQLQQWTDWESGTETGRHLYCSSRPAENKLPQRIIIIPDGRSIKISSLNPHLFWQNLTRKTHFVLEVKSINLVNVNHHNSP